MCQGFKAPGAARRLFASEVRTKPLALHPPCIILRKASACGQHRRGQQQAAVAWQIQGNIAAAALPVVAAGNVGVLVGIPQEKLDSQLQAKPPVRRLKGRIAGILRRIAFLHGDDRRLNVIHAMDIIKGVFPRRRVRRDGVPAPVGHGTQGRLSSEVAATAVSTGAWRLVHFLRLIITVSESESMPIIEDGRI